MRSFRNPPVAGFWKGMTVAFRPRSDIHQHLCPRISVLGLWLGPILSICLLAPAAPAQTATQKAGADRPKFKAIWEPVPFNRDISLKAIACAGPETCWVAGDKSTILFTTDGGKTWQAQLGGDPEGTEEDLNEIFFLDSKSGWVMSERSKIMGTRNGATWAALGAVRGTSRGLRFMTADVGLLAENSDSIERSHLNRTQNGGKTWEREHPCAVEAVIGGLARKLGCLVRRIAFLSPTLGFVGGGATIAMATRVALFGKTTDGGATWAYSVIPETKHQVDEIHFWSEKDGLVVLASGQTYWTADGGATWTGSLNPPGWRSYYAAAEGKILVGVNRTGRQIGYSFNGGRSFSSRPVTLPASANGVTFFDARHGYLVGDHGMVFRYRIVPIDYSVPGIIAAMAP